MERIQINNPNSKVFFTSDPHFYHGAIIRLCDRPFTGPADMNKQLINNWNSVVSDNDDVFILGDFCLGSKNKWINILDKLNGRKHLIRGNHDKENSIPYDKFETVNDLVKLTLFDRNDYKHVNLVLCHYCLTSWDGQWKGTVHLFGHSHSAPNKCDTYDYDYIKNRPLPSYDVGVDNNNFFPIEYNELRQIFKTQLNEINDK